MRRITQSNSPLVFVKRVIIPVTAEVVYIGILAEQGSSVEVLQSDPFQPSANELFQYSVDIPVVELFFSDTGDRPRLAENERKIESHQSIWCQIQ